MFSSRMLPPGALSWGLRGLSQDPLDCSVCILPYSSPSSFKWERQAAGPGAPQGHKTRALLPVHTARAEESEAGEAPNVREDMCSG